MASVRCRGVEPGGGRIVLRSHGPTVCFSELSSTYPLKLLSPRIREGVAVAYILTYGGGLVGGDRINVDVDVGPGAVIVLLSQASPFSMYARTEAYNCDRDLPRFSRLGLGTELLLAVQFLPPPKRQLPCRIWM
jgi:hypothetical protein